MDAANISGGLALRGILAILFGVAAVFWPGITLVTLIYLFSAFILINGVIDLVVGLGRLFQGGRSLLTRVLVVLLGGLEVGVGIYLLRHIHVGFGVLILLIGFLFIVRGVFEIVEALFEEGAGAYRIVMALVGVLAVLVGVIMLFQPIASGVAFVWILGMYGLIAGPLMIAGASQVHRLEAEQRRLEAETTRRPAKA